MTASAIRLRLQSEPRISFDDPPLEDRTLSLPPQAAAVNETIEDCSSVRSFVPLQGECRIFGNFDGQIDRVSTA
jgi:hypothetical protein